MAARARGNGALWFAVAGGPAAWSLDTLAAIAIENDYCAHGAAGISSPGGGVTTLLLGIALTAAAVAVLAGLTGWRHVRDAGADTGLGDTDDDRRRFMARFGVVISALTLFAIVMRMITVLFIAPAAC
jgi:hypothetical protein